MATQHFIGHFLHALVLTMNAVFAVFVICKHSELRQTMGNLFGLWNIVTSTKRNKVEPVENSNGNEMKQTGKNEGDQYYAALANVWSTEFKRLDMA